MSYIPAAENAPFLAGENVVLAEGPYQGTTGVFVKLRDDIRWAEIKQWNGVVQIHPIVWLRRRELPQSG